MHISPYTPYIKSIIASYIHIILKSALCLVTKNILASTASIKSSELHSVLLDS